MLVTRSRVARSTPVWVNPHGDVCRDVAVQLWESTDEASFGSPRSNKERCARRISILLGQLRRSRRPVLTQGPIRTRRSAAALGRDDRGFGAVQADPALQPVPAEVSSRGPLRPLLASVSLETRARTSSDDDGSVTIRQEPDAFPVGLSPGLHPTQIRAVFGLRWFVSHFHHGAALAAGNVVSPKPDPVAQQRWRRPCADVVCR